MKAGELPSFEVDKKYHQTQAHTHTDGHHAFAQQTTHGFRPPFGRKSTMGLAGWFLHQQFWRYGLPQLRQLPDGLMHLLGLVALLSMAQHQDAPGKTMRCSVTAAA